LYSRFQNTLLLCLRALDTDNSIHTTREGHTHGARDRTHPPRRRASRRTGRPRPRHVHRSGSPLSRHSPRHTSSPVPSRPAPLRLSAWPLARRRVRERFMSYSRCMSHRFMSHVHCMSHAAAAPAAASS